MLKLKNSAMLVVAVLCGYLALMTPDWKSDLVAASGVAYLNDQNGDSRADILMRSTSTGVLSLSLIDSTGLATQNNLDPGTFEDPELLVVSTGDFNGDKNADILMRGTANFALPNTFYVALTDATGAVFDSAFLGTMSTDPNDVVVSTKDYNFDGIADVLLRNTVTGVFTMNYMNGTGTPVTGTLPGITTDLCYSYKGDGDYDGNLVPDIYMRRDLCGAPYTNAIYTMKGDFNFYKSSLTVGITQSAAFDVLDADHDWNGDGRDDILFRQNSGSPKLWVSYWMNGINAPTGNSNLAGVAVQSMWDFATLGDFNGDGITDLIIRQVNTGSWYGYLLNANGNVAPTGSNLGYISTNMNVNLIWQLQDTDDFNGDGKTDLLLRNTATGAWQVNLFNGLTQTSGSLPGVVTSLDYTIQND